MTSSESARSRGVAFGVLLALDRAEYDAGAPIRAEIRAFAPVDEPVLLEFTSAQRTDLMIQTDDGREVLRWSEGQMFAQLVEEVRLDAEGLVGALEIRAPDRPGRYKVSAWVTAVNREVQASIEIEVR